MKTTPITSIASLKAVSARTAKAISLSLPAHVQLCEFDWDRHALFSLVNYSLDPWAPGVTQIRHTHSV